MQIKDEFPFFKKFPNFIYADSAATTLKPTSIIDAITFGYTYYTLPAGKSIYELAENAFEETEIKTKQTIRSLYQIKNHDIFFGCSVTILLDKLFFLLKKKFHDKDSINIVLPSTTHNAILFAIQTHFDTKSHLVYFQDNNDLERKISSAEIIILPIIDHISGKIFWQEQIEILKNKHKNKIFILDGSQSFSFFPYIMENSLVDFILWSSHKMYGPDNIAVLLGQQEAMSLLIDRNNIQIDTKHKLEFFFKSGSFSYASLFGFNTCLTWIKEKIYSDKNYLIKHKYFTQTIRSELEKKRIHLLSAKESINIISFTSETTHAHDIALFFSENNIGIRSGELCSNMFTTKKGIARISLGYYIEEKDIELIQYVIKKI